MRRTLQIHAPNIANIDPTFVITNVPTWRNALLTISLPPRCPDVLEVNMQGLHMTAYSPLGHAEPDILGNKVVKEIAQETGHSASQVKPAQATRSNV